MSRTSLLIRLWPAFTALLITSWPALGTYSVAQEGKQEATIAQPASVPAPRKHRDFRHGVTSTVQLPSAYLRQVRKRLVAGKQVRFNDLRALADAGDSLAQMQFAKRLSGDTDAKHVRSQIHYYAMAAYNGRVGAVRPLLNLLRSSGAGMDASVLKNAENALSVQATHGQPDAVVGLAEFYLAGAPFGDKHTEGIKLLATSVIGDDHQSALDLAVLLLKQPGDPEARRLAVEYLGLAAQSPKPAIRTTAETLLRSQSSEGSQG
jgi:hypothetical protein